jgi:hypothetical protein
LLLLEVGVVVELLMIRLAVVALVVTENFLHKP